MLPDGHCQALSWEEGGQVFLILKIYLDSHDTNTRISQLRGIELWCENFKQQQSLPVRMVLGGDRNFVTNPEEHFSSEHTSWHPGDTMMKAWGEFLGRPGSYEIKQPTHTSIASAGLT